MKEIDVLISKDGSKIEMDAVGFEGEGCADILGKLSKALGTVEKTQNKDDFYRKPLQSIKA